MPNERSGSPDAARDLRSAVAEHEPGTWWGPDGAQISRDELLALLDERKAYGAKFRAISSALGHAYEARRLLDDGDEQCAMRAIDAVIGLLRDA